MKELLLHLSDEVLHRPLELLVSAALQYLLEARRAQRVSYLHRTLKRLAPKPQFGVKIIAILSIRYLVHVLLDLARRLLVLYAGQCKRLVAYWRFPLCGQFGQVVPAVGAAVALHFRMPKCFLRHLLKKKEYSSRLGRL